MFCNIAIVLLQSFYLFVSKCEGKPCKYIFINSSPNNTALIDCSLWSTRSGLKTTGRICKEIPLGVPTTKTDSGLEL